MAKKTNVEAPAPTTPAKRTTEEKAQRKSAKVGQRATNSLTNDRAEKKANQKQTLKSAAKQLQKELDTRMNDVVARIRKETKAKLKEVVKDATRRLDVDTERMFEQALHTIVRHYDSIAPGRTAGINLPAPSAEQKDTAEPASSSAAANSKKKPTLNKDGLPRRNGVAKAATPAASKKGAGRPAGSTSKLAPATGRGPGRPKRQLAADGLDATPELSTPVATTNDSVAVDNA